MLTNIAILLIAASLLVLVASCNSQPSSEQRVGASNAIVRQPNVIDSIPVGISLPYCELEVAPEPQPIEDWFNSPEDAELAGEWKPSSTNRAISALDPDTATLGQILDRSRLAMGDIVTYKACTTTVERRSPDQEFTLGFFAFTSVHSYDHQLSVVKDSEHRGGESWENLLLGSRRFERNTDHGWQESKVDPARGMQPVPPSEGIAWVLYEDDIELISTNETADNGEKVYRLAFTSMLDGFINEEEVQTARTTSVLINQETFRIVSFIQEKYPSFKWSNDWSQNVSYVDWWLSNVYTQHYYDYNLPVVLEAPEKYVPFEETVMSR